mmetsp:Transcript_23718/g.21080  ORF Transcript_23718/g.21080 Transcript_23718/m.21080 type:complete len:89 (+) Transcript_23718:568-834(+)
MQKKSQVLMDKRLDLINKEVEMNKELEQLNLKDEESETLTENEEIETESKEETEELISESKEDENEDIEEEGTFARKRFSTDSESSDY